MKELGMTKDTIRDEDPREAFLRHNCRGKVDCFK
jgi:hypothetical protein